MSVLDVSGTYLYLTRQIGAPQSPSGPACLAEASADGPDA